MPSALQSMVLNSLLHLILAVLQPVVNSNAFSKW